MPTEVYCINYEIQITFLNGKKKFYFSHSKSVKYRKDSIFLTVILLHIDSGDNMVSHIFGNHQLLHLDT